MPRQEGGPEQDEPRVEHGGESAYRTLEPLRDLPSSPSRTDPSQGGEQQGIADEDHRRKIVEVVTGSIDRIFTK
jgi:hypothetical protein